VPVVFATSNQSTYVQSNNLIKIPVNSSTAFLDGPNSFLKLTYLNNSGRVQKFNNSGHSLIEHIRILTRGSEVLENIQHYNQIHCVMSDLLLSGENRLVKEEQGYGNPSIPALAVPLLPSADVLVAAENVAAGFPAVVAATAVAFTVGPIVLELAKLGNQINAARLGQQCLNELTVAVGGVVTLCLPLELSCTVGGAQQKLLPLWMMGEVVIEIQLNRDCVFNPPVIGENAAAAIARRNAAPTFAVSEVEFHGSLIEFESSVNMALTSMAVDGGMGLNLSGCTWTNSMVSLAGAMNTLTNNERVRSLKSLFLAFVENGLTYGDRKTARHNNGVTSIQYKFGSQYLPTYPIRGDSTNKNLNGEFVVELLKAASEYGSNMHTGLINCTSFANLGHADNDCGKSCYGIDCDAFGREHVESGLSTVENNPITIKWDKVGAVVNQDAYLFLYHDVIYNILPNGIVSRSVM